MISLVNIKIPNFLWFFSYLLIIFWIENYVLCKTFLLNSFSIPYFKLFEVDIELKDQGP